VHPPRRSRSSPEPSSGIGLELARRFAEHGFDVLVTAEDSELAVAAAELRRSTAAQLGEVRADLADYDGVEQLYQAIRQDGRPVAALALNAGVGLGGDFARDQSLEDALRLVRLNVESTVHLAKRVLPDMAARRDGKVLFTSSIASESPGPCQALYNASKSFVQSFAEALADELRESGVTVTALMPGPTDTEFFRRAGLEDTKLGSGKKDDPALVASQGFEALMAGKTRVQAGGLASRAQAEAMKVLPDMTKAAIHRHETGPGSAES
jgi:short-subunit dehydrogenase